MIVRVFIILMVIQAITCEKAVSKLRRKLMVPKISEKCKKIKCAAVDEPICVRMRRHDLSLTIHIIAVNKCELEYMKCHDDVEAKIVPMKYCSHIVAETDGKKKNKPGKAHIRVKRRVKPVMRPVQRQAEETALNTTTTDPITGFKGNNNKTKHPKLKKMRINSKKVSLKWKNEDSNVIPKGNDKSLILKGHGAVRQNVQSVGYYPFSSETDSDIEKNERKKINKGVAGHLLDIRDEVSSMQHLQLQPKAFMSPSMLAMKGNRPYSLSQTQENVKELSFWGSQENGPEFPMLSQEAVNFSKESLTESDKNEYEALCPSFCPARDIMVCGKCQHGVYKTFLSVCHLRMFICRHQEESLQLVSRFPCVLSAPYIPDKYEKPKGRISEAGDDDRILRFIMCRDQGKLGTDGKPPADPRCDFTKKPVRRGIGIELSSSSSEKDSSSDSIRTTRSSEWSKTSDKSSSDLSSSYSASGFSSSGVVSDSSSC